jgi:hypothetical protein
MSIGKTLSIVSLACVLPLAACEEESPSNDDGAVQTDGAVSNGGNGGNGGDGGGPATPDSGSVPGQGGQTDAGVPSTGDAGAQQPSSSDGGVRTATGNKFFLPTGEVTNTAAPRVEVDAAGNTHAVYPAFFKGDAFYTVCEGECSDPSKLSAVRFETDGTVYNAMLKLTADGKPRVLLSSYYHNYFAECDAGCSVRENWRVGEIQQLSDSDLSITGEALALDPQGRPRFLYHTYHALFGIGQKPPQTSLAACDAVDCTKPESWTFNVIAKDELWENSTLLYDASGRGHVATHVVDFSSANNPTMGAYLTCTGACNTENTWKGIGFFPAYESMTEAIDMHPAISLALTKAGHPRVAQLGKTPEGKKVVAYFECDQDCDGDNWKNGFSWIADPLHDGIDLALDKDDHPRFAHTINYNIVVTYCNDADCTREGAGWDSIFVEQGEDIPADQIFLEWNCTFGAWFLHTPSIAITSSGALRVGYQIRDVSGGFGKPDPTKPGCTAGTDMSLSRMAVLPTL